ncbi:hypothetical protein PIB30_034011 [Stylosanthes scabra]|uniref:Uncharacterized protein n=1 Tax=Stylosanthes scabra TaxID=79078 RepID=A0ABU6VCD8_9FABA|nr:hypothetical protein [Stylosanthes scabra]
MDNNKKQGSSSSTLKNFDQLFGPKDSSSSASSSSNALFGSIFPPSSSVGGRDYSRTQDVAGKHFGISGGSNSSRISNKNESVVEPNYYSSSIYYGGQEIYSPRSTTTAAPPTTTQPHHHIFKKDKEDGDPNSDPRGNWWQGSLYY